MKSSIHTAAARLTAVTDSPRLDAELLLAHCLARPRTYLIAWPDTLLSDVETRCFDELVARRAGGEPVAHILGVREFWSLALEVTPATLIPRPETELLVERALDLLPAGAALDVLDLGTGSGAIALAVATERPACSVTATERSAEALAVARRNAERLAVRNLRLLAGDWYAPVAAKRFDLILSNPPYIRAGDPHLETGDVRFDPTTALVAGTDGLDALRLIIAGASARLRAGGWLLVEHGYDQGEAVTRLFADAGFADIETLPDLGGRPRVTLGHVGQQDGQGRR